MSKLITETLLILYQYLTYQKKFKIMLLLQLIIFYRNSWKDISIEPLINGLSAQFSVIKNIESVLKYNYKKQIGLKSNDAIKEFTTSK
jgi:hypothetical protein